MPKMTATMQSIVPPFDFEITLKINPTIAKGMLIQFSQPSSGMNASSIPIAARIPRISPIIFIVLFFKLMCFHSQETTLICFDENKNEFVSLFHDFL